MRIILVLAALFISQNLFSQYARSIEIDTYKYIVIDEISGKHTGEMRRFFVKNLKNSGYNVINLKEPLKTHNELPADLKENPDLALYLVTKELNTLCYNVSTNLINAAGDIIITRDGSSCGLLSTAIKQSISNLTSYNYKYDPKLKRTEQKNIKMALDEWVGNGSGVIISKFGHILTNNHVVQGVKEIEIEVLYDEKIRKFKAEVVTVDKSNDLAILKISNLDFNGFNDIPYNFNNNISQVGTKVYAYGYPLALSIMGKEIKVTDGIISSKSGFAGDITTYQVTAAIQPGNSGGPLFDDLGNLIGITSSGINKSIADNVSYAIKIAYAKNLIDMLPNKIELPSSIELKTLSLVDQIKALSKFVALIKVK
jgi:S1-C subfamily serine protease